jgi:hypothetical protein
VTGETQSFRWPSGFTDQLVEVIYDGTSYWASEGDFRNAVGQAYPPAQGTARAFRTAQRRSEPVSDSW